MKKRQLETYLKVHGCVFYREGGSHEVWLNPANEKQTAIPRHREIKRGTAIRACQQLGIPAPDFK